MYTNEIQQSLSSSADQIKGKENENSVNAFVYIYRKSAVTYAALVTLQ